MGRGDSQESVMLQFEYKVAIVKGRDDAGWVDGLDAGQHCFDYLGPGAGKP